jgi:shikimate kinase
MKETLRENKKSLIFLTGFMGSGKSTIGPILANTLGYEYVDVDRFIEQKTKKEIVEIFRTEGEKAFRLIERNTLNELTKLDHSVISLGGGTIANEENCQIVSQNGILIYLKLSSEEIIQRVQYKSDRPMLKDASGNPLQGKELEKRIVELLLSREPFYSRADVVIHADNMRIGVTVDEIIKNIRGMIDEE